MGLPRKIETAAELEYAWGCYKTECDSQNVLTHEFSAKNSEFVSKELRRAVTYTIAGFCVFLGLARKNFYESYVDAPAFRTIVSRIREECEVDARKKFELGVIPSQLSGLWMSKYGYTTKNDTNITGAVPVVVSGGDELAD